MATQQMISPTTQKPRWDIEVSISQGHQNDIYMEPDKNQIPIPQSRYFVFADNCHVEKSQNNKLFISQDKEMYAGIIDSNSSSPARNRSSPSRKGVNAGGKHLHTSSPIRNRSSPSKRSSKTNFRSSSKIRSKRDQMLFLISLASVVLVFNTIIFMELFGSKEKRHWNRIHRNQQSTENFRAPRIFYLTDYLSHDSLTGGKKRNGHLFFLLGKKFNAKLGRTIDLGPNVYSDVTQTYPMTDSSDTPSMEKRIFPLHETDEMCVPTSTWQKQSHPSCNFFHEINIHSEMKQMHLELFGTKGFWRYAWMLKDPKDRDIKHGQLVVLKTIKYMHNLEEAYYENNRVDSIAMERLTSSPYVIDIFGFCAMSVLTDYAGESFQYHVRKAKPIKALTMAKHVAEGLAAVHGIDGDTHSSLVHNDLNIANVMIGSAGVPQLNDFNIAILSMKNKKTQEPCGFTGHFPNPQWKSPEEQVVSQDSMPPENLTEKIDVYALGNIYFKILTGHSPWHIDKIALKNEVKAKIVQAKLRGEMPPIPEVYQNSEDPFHQTLLHVIKECYKFDPKDRPSAQQIAQIFGREINKMKRGKDQKDKIKKKDFFELGY